MKKELLAVFCSVLIGLCAAGFLTMAESREPAGTVAWWSLVYEQPNPDRLPVQVHFKWLKGLD